METIGGYLRVGLHHGCGEDCVQWYDLQVRLLLHHLRQVVKQLLVAHHERQCVVRVARIVTALGTAAKWVNQVDDVARVAIVPDLWLGILVPAVRRYVCMIRRQERDNEQIAVVG